MRAAQLLVVTLLLVGTAVSAGCGGVGSGNDVLVSIGVTPVSQTAASGTSTGKVQFSATGTFAPLVPLPCGPASQCVSIPGSPDFTRVLTNAAWTTADALSTTIDSSGLAVCLSATTGPVRIAASAPGYNSNGVYTTISGRANLTCN